MVDQTLEDYELRVQEARLKLAWFDEEFRELQLLPDVSEYIRLSNIKLIYLTPEEHARREELAKTPDGVQFLRNENNTMYTNRELSHALSDLIKYRRNNKTPRQGSTDKWRNLDDAASSDDESLESGVLNPKNKESSNGGEIEKDSLQQQRQQQLPPALPELKQRKRCGI